MFWKRADNFPEKGLGKHNAEEDKQSKDRARAQHYRNRKKGNNQSDKENTWWDRDRNIETRR
jgi:hypothetical protein